MAWRIPPPAFYRAREKEEMRIAFLPPRARQGVTLAAVPARAWKGFSTTKWPCKGREGTPGHLTIVSPLSYNCRRRESSIAQGFQGMNASHWLCQESSRAANSPLLRRDCGLRSSLPGRADKLDLGDADPAERTAGAGPQTGAPIPALARAQGDESRQSDPELHEVHDGAEEILLRRGGVSSAARSCWPCRSRSCPRRSCRNTAGPR